jgi:hypothetical protein
VTGVVQESAVCEVLSVRSDPKRTLLPSLANIVYEKAASDRVVQKRRWRFTAK